MTKFIKKSIFVMFSLAVILPFIIGANNDKKFIKETDETTILKPCNPEPPYGNTGK